ncbi:hypothetical protein SERLADRAFT_475312 [Serpula lacrymans var. lacrymans S7.9]|uniref:Uncharacterized protein n=1 Tax=Serpula lacrymans var. lacrymans (strain S7.9) TaxID=578457 RepID=F8P653_SERL9|nr:uncharacterized protein SERLADRAFT_475312 [Serpula lacrymans var. lacrymans S7.9]EGO20920.1 hypothetical protein SERLADRAFT_475312 [Serpula lacrymans var. lacrymans S7.9]
MEFPNVFMKTRAVAFSFIIIASFLWVILLSLELFTRWDVSSTSNRSLVVVLLLVNTITIIMLPVLLLLGFRVWLDAARLFFLLIAHIGTAAAFTYWNPKFQCPDQTPDQYGVCKLINIYTLIGCWIIPVVLVLYSGILAFTIYRGYPMEEEMQGIDNSTVGRQSILPIMNPEKERRPSTTSNSSISPLSKPAHISFSMPSCSSSSPVGRLSLDPHRISSKHLTPASRDVRRFTADHKSLTSAADAALRRHISSPASSFNPDRMQVDMYQKEPIAGNSRRSAGRLSKPLPPWYF